MKESQKKIVNVGPSALSLLGVAFVVLKLCGVIGAGSHSAWRSPSSAW